MPLPETVNVGVQLNLGRAFSVIVRPTPLSSSVQNTTSRKAWISSAELPLPWVIVKSEYHGRIVCESPAESLPMPRRELPVPNSMPPLPMKNVPCEALYWQAKYGVHPLVWSSFTFSNLNTFA